MSYNRVINQKKAINKWAFWYDEFAYDVMKIECLSLLLQRLMLWVIDNSFKSWEVNSCEWDYKDYGLLTLKLCHYEVIVNI